MIHFDFDDRYLDEQVVGTAISRREAVLVSIVFHSLIAIALVFLPTLPMFQQLAEELQLRRAQRAAKEAPPPPRENRTFVFVQPRVDIEAPRPPDRGENSDKDRVSQTRERAEKPTNPLPFSRGNTSNRVESAEMSRPAGPVSPAPPSPGEVARAEPPPPDPSLRRLPSADTGIPVPPEPAPPEARAGSGALGEAMRNLQRYVQREALNNPGGGDTKFGPFIQFDTKGVEFGPWIRAFVAQVKRNWFIPDAAMALRGHVVLQFNVHKDGRITDVAVVGPSNVAGFNNASHNAILASNPTAPLPPDYPADKAFFTVTFYYNEEPAGQ